MEVTITLIIAASILLFIFMLCVFGNLTPISRLVQQLGESVGSVVLQIRRPLEAPKAPYVATPRKYPYMAEAIFDATEGSFKRGDLVAVLGPIVGSNGNVCIANKEGLVRFPFNEEWNFKPIKEYR